MIRLLSDAALAAVLILLATRTEAAAPALSAEIDPSSLAVDWQREVTLAVAPDGGFVVAWSSLGSAGDDTQGMSIQARRFHADGAPAAEQFQVNATAAGEQQRPSAAMGPSGQFVVVWAIHDEAGIQGRRFEADGSPSGEDFTISAAGTDPRVAFGPDGGFVVVWDNAASFPRQVAARRYLPDGSAAGPQFLVSNDVHTIIWPAVAADGLGRFVFVWSAYGSFGDDTSAYSIHARRYAADASPLADQFQVNSTTPGAQQRPRVAARLDGSFIVVWDQLPLLNDFDEKDIRARMFDSSGDAVGPDFRAHPSTKGLQQLADVAAGTGGDFVVTWTEAPKEYGVGEDVMARRFKADGTPLENPWLVNSSIVDLERGASAGVQSDGDLVIAWETWKSDEVADVRVQVFDDLPRLCAPVPMSPCRTAAAGRSRIQIKDKIRDASDSFKWKWGQGEATAISAFADPVDGAANYRLCVYDASASPQPIWEAALPPGGTCSDKPCWRDISGKGYGYRNGSALPEGISAASLKSGDPGKSSLQLKARGSAMRTPQLPLTGPIAVQLVVDDGVTQQCWGTTFSNADVNRMDMVKAKGP